MRKRNRYILIGLLLALTVPAVALIVAGKPASIHDAARDDRLGWVRVLVTVKPSLLNSQDEWGRTPLHLAVEEGHEDVVELLLAKGADTEVKDRVVGTPLHVAARRGQRRLAQALLAQGADVEAEGANIRTPLYQGVMFDRNDVVELLLTQGVEVNATDRYGWSPLHYAAMGRGTSPMCDLLMTNGAEVDVFAATARASGRSPVILMATRRCWRRMQRMASRWCISPAGSAISPVVDLVLAEGVVVDVADQGGATALCWAAGGCHDEIVRLLLAKGADVDGGSKAPVAPLLGACEARCWGIAEELLGRGADVNVVDGLGATPLHYVASSGDVELARLVLAKGADVNAQDFTELTPLDWVSGSEEMALLLKEHRESQQ